MKRLAQWQISEFVTSMNVPAMLASEQLQNV